MTQRRVSQQEPIQGEWFKEAVGCAFLVSRYEEEVV
jgi:hypothetical protein